MLNRVIHFEIHAADTAKMAAFYRDLFGWEIRKWDNPGVDFDRPLSLNRFAHRLFP
jgi:predicted enzyme related to lactoylglutathione lyase